MSTPNPRNLPSRQRNARTALVLVSVAAMFFAGVFLARFLGADGTGLTVLGIAILVFLAVAIGRNLRGRE